MRVGIQGGAGSFNEEVARHHLPQLLDSNFELVYLYTTSNVLDALDAHVIDFGQFAIHNSLGGEVEESTDATKNHNFKVTDKYSLAIRHALMSHKSARLKTIEIVMGHPQALKQCQQTLAQRHSHLRLLAGEDEQSDPAKVAEDIAEGVLPTSTAVLGSRALAGIWGLQILDENLQDSDDNVTTFVLVKPQDKI